MALTITIEGKGVIANADSLTADTGGLGTGTWHELGGGGIALSGVAIQGGSAIAGAYSNKDGWQYFDIQAGNELDFTPTTGTEDGQHVYMWIQMPALSQLDTLANNGLSIRLGTSTTDYRDWTIAGNDGSNGWTGGWQCFVIDPTKAGTIADTGTFDIASVRMFGVWLNTSSAGRGDNFFMDQIMVGKGLRITGTSTTGWLDVVNYCNDFATRAWGMLQEKDGIYYAYGNMIIGDATNQAANADFADSGRVIKFATSEFWSTGTTWLTGIDIDLSGITIEDHTSFTTTFTDGILVGTDSGRSGTLFIGNSLMNVSADLHGGNHIDSATLLYGTTIKEFTGLLNSGDDAGHKFFSTSFLQSNIFDPIGACVIRNCTFAETVDIDACLLWNESIDISDSAFIANTLGAAIEHPSAVGTPYDYFDLSFSGNTFDGLNTSGTDITVNNNGTSDAINDEGANTITYLSSATLTMVVKDVTGTEVVGAFAYIDDNNLTPFIMNTVTNASGIASVGHTAGAVAGATWRIRKYGYKPFIAIADIPASGTKEIPVTLIVDPQQT